MQTSDYFIRSCRASCLNIHIWNICFIINYFYVFFILELRLYIVLFCIFVQYVTYQFHFRLVKKVLQFFLLLWNGCWSDRFEKCCLITPSFTLLSAVVIWTGSQAYWDFIKKKKGSEYARIGEDNGNPLQYSCLGNPMDGAAW